MSITMRTGRAPAQLARILRRSVAVPVVALPVDAFATVAAEPPTTPAPGGDLPASVTNDRFGRSAQPRRRFGRRAAQLAVTAAVALSVVGLASPAQAYGYDSSRWADVDYNGTWDYIWDWDADGDADAVYLNFNGDGYWDIGLGDANEDGVIDLYDGNGDFWFEYTDYDQNGRLDQMPSQGTALVIDSGCGDGHCVSPDMGMVGLALPSGWNTFGYGGFAPEAVFR